MQSIRTLTAILFSSLLAISAWAEPTAPTQKSGAGNMTVVIMETSKGPITLELDGNKAPITTANFVSYVKDGFYNGTIFHRVISGFMIQGGGFEADMSQKSTKAPIKNESTNGLGNKRGTIAMARTNNPDSATAQFFINLVDNGFLDGTSYKPGYAVFGKVTSGMGVVDQIAAVNTGRRGPYGDVPVEPVMIKSVTIKQP